MLQVALGACRAVSAPTCVVVDVAAEMSLSCTVGVVRIVVGTLTTVAEDGCRAAGRQEGRRGDNGSLIPNPPFLTEIWARNQASWVMEGRLRLWSAGGDEGGGRGLEANEMGHESLGAVQLVLKFAEAEVGGSKAAPRGAKPLVLSNLPSCQGLKQGFGRDALALRGVQSEASVFHPFGKPGEPQAVPSSK